MLATIQNYAERVKAGRAVESRIFHAWQAKLQSRGIKLELPTTTEDKKDKIDLWLINPKGKRFSVQVKYRESGDDIIFEIIKNVQNWTIGRDVASVAQLYFFVDRTGKGWLYWSKPLKELADHLTSEAQKSLETSPNQTEWDGQGYEMKRRMDPASGEQKLVAFISPRKFPSIETFEGII